MPELRAAWVEIRKVGSAPERMTSLVRALKSVPLDLDLPTLQAIADVAEDIQSSDPHDVPTLMDQLLGQKSPACRWMTACLLEQRNDPEKAVEALDSFTILQSAEAEALRLQALCRNLIAGQRWAEAVGALKESTRRTNSLRVLLGNEKLLNEIRRAGHAAAKRESRIALLGNVTFDLMAPVLRICAFASGINLETYLGSYGQYRQEILNPPSALENFHPSLVLLALDWRCLGLPEISENPDSQVGNALAELQNLWRQCRKRFQASLIQHNFEVPASSAYGRLSQAAPGGRARLIERVNLELWSAASAEPGVHIVDVDQIASAYGKGRWENRVLWHAAKQYPAADAVPVLARHQVALLRASLGLSSKCLVLDLDGTLWGGIVGEDGMAGIQLGGSALGDAYREFQSYVKSLGERGVVLAVCSKNNEADAKLVLTSHPEMVLSADDFAISVMNWRPKDENLRRIAEALNIGLDSIVFVDDNPVERAWIRRQLPEVEVPEMPLDPADYARVLAQGLYFETLEVTEDDRHRARYYRGNLEREQFQTASASLEEFLAGLQMRVELRPFDEANLPRIVQLFNKTNQFNLTTQRMSEGQVKDLIGAPGHYTLFMRVCDRFGDNGITGVLTASRIEKRLEIDNWLMSCRVLGRKLEEVMLGAIRRFAFASGCNTLVGIYQPTKKNVQVADLYDRLGFERLETTQNGERRYHQRVEMRTEYPSEFAVEDFTQALGSRQTSLESVGEP